MLIYFNKMFLLNLFTTIYNQICHRTAVTLVSILIFDLIIQFNHENSDANSAKCLSGH